MKIRYAYCVAAALLTQGCSSTSGTQSDAGSNSREAADCIVREAKAIAAVKVDLETAASAVIARCSTYTDATRQSLVARFPGHRDYIETQTREMDEIYMDQARRAVALFRTS